MIAWMLLLVLVLLVSLLVSALAASGPAPAQVSRSAFGQADGQPVELFTLRNSKGAEATITNYGGIVVTLKVPDRNGRLDDVVLGHDSLDGYLKSSPYFGCLVGRYGNQIGRASCRERV